MKPTSCQSSSCLRRLATRTDTLGLSSRGFGSGSGLNLADLRALGKDACAHLKRLRMGTVPTRLICREPVGQHCHDRVEAVGTRERFADQRAPKAWLRPS